MPSHYFLTAISILITVLGTANAQDNQAASDKKAELSREITDAPAVVQARDTTDVLFRDFGRVPKGKICKCSIRIANPTGEVQAWYVRNGSCSSMCRGLEARFRMANGDDGFAATLKSMESNVIEISVDTSRFDGACTGKVYLHVNTEKGLKEFRILISAHSDPIPVS